MRDQEVLDLYEAYASIYAQEEVEQLDEAQAARENPEGHDKEEKKKYAHVRGERTPMPPRGNKKREDFEKWYAANVREETDLFDTILEHLVAEGYADTNEAALVIMANMSEEWRRSILDESILDVAAKVGKVAGKVANDVKDRVTGKKELLSGPQGYVRVGGPSKPGDVRVSGIGPVGTYGRKYTPQSGDRPITVGIRR